MLLYHAGREIIKSPDIRLGRRNADFGPGFYLTPDIEFARRWAGRGFVINVYEFDEDDLAIRTLVRDRQWFDYISRNRRGEDTMTGDAIIGPIANDTIFDTLGIFTSGLIDDDTALRLLCVGPEYTQAAIKTEAAVRHLTWRSSVALAEPVDRRREQEEYQRQLSSAMSRLL